MPVVKEITSSSSLSKSLGDKGQVAYSITRAFRIVLDSPGATPNYEQLTGVFVGSRHPTAPSLVCRSYDARYEGDSRMSLVVTFQYEPLAGPDDEDNRDKPPEIRPANWSISSSTYELPVTMWRKRQKKFEWQAQPVTATNPVGDIYDGLSKLEPIVQIKISQWEAVDPTRNCQYVGSTNEEEIKLKTLDIRPHQLLYVGMSSTPAVETFNEQSFRGWRVEYDFQFKRNPQKILYIDDNNEPLTAEVDIGWDIAVPQTGFNVRAFDPAVAPADVDVFGQPLKHGEKSSQFYGRIPPPPFELPEGVAVGDKVRAMVKVFSYQNGGTSQSPSSQPVAINDDGLPMDIRPAANPPVLPIVYGYQVYNAINITNSLRLRLQ